MRWALLAVGAAVTPECSADVRAAEARVSRIGGNIREVQESVRKALEVAAAAKAHALEHSAARLLKYREDLIKRDAELLDQAHADGRQVKLDEVRAIQDAQTRYLAEQAPTPFGPGEPSFDLNETKQAILAESQVKLGYLAGNLSHEVVELEYRGENALLYAEQKAAAIEAEYAEQKAELDKDLEEVVAWESQKHALEASLAAMNASCQQTFVTPAPTPVDFDQATPPPTPYDPAYLGRNLTRVDAPPPGGAPGDKPEDRPPPEEPLPSPQWPEDDVDATKRAWENINSRLEALQATVFDHHLGPTATTTAADAPAADPSTATTAAPAG